MSKTISIEVSDDTYDEILRRAKAEGTTPVAWLSARIAKLMIPRDERLRRHFGSFDLGAPLVHDPNNK